MKVKKVCDKCGLLRNELYMRGNKMYCGSCVRGGGRLSKYTIRNSRYERDKLK